MKHGRRGRDSGYAPAPATSPSIKSKYKEELNSSTASTHGKHRRSSLHSPTAIRRGKLRRSRQRAIQLRKTPGSPIKQQGDESEGTEAPRGDFGSGWEKRVNRRVAASSGLKSASEE